MTIKRGECQGYCGEPDKVLYHDPKSPCMSFDPCLCLECAKSHYQEEAERLESEAQNDGIELEITCNLFEDKA
jgi:hypothetical protein